MEHLPVHRIEVIGSGCFDFMLAMAKNIVAALEEASVKRIIWITGMGIHHEIKGMRGVMLNMLAKKRPDYIQAADTIAASKAVTTLLRCPGIQKESIRMSWL